jgi:hypothetical protein
VNQRRSVVSLRDGDLVQLNDGSKRRVAGMPIITRTSVGALAVILRFRDGGSFLTLPTTSSLTVVAGEEHTG